MCMQSSKTMCYKYSIVIVTETSLEYMIVSFFSIILFCRVCFCKNYKQCFT